MASRRQTAAARAEAQAAAPSLPHKPEIRKLRSPNKVPEVRYTLSANKFTEHKDRETQAGPETSRIRQDLQTTRALDPVSSNALHQVRDYTNNTQSQIVARRAAEHNEHVPVLLCRLPEELIEQCLQPVCKPGIVDTTLHITNRRPSFLPHLSNVPFKPPRSYAASGSRF
jgi:hypothetical protein